MGCSFCRVRDRTDMPRAPKRCDRCGFVGVGACRCVSPTSRASWSRPERRRRAAAVADWVAAYGWWCPGWGVEPHVSTDLTAAHSTAVVHGGAESPLTVLCRSCNSRAWRVGET